MSLLALVIGAVLPALSSVAVAGPDESSSPTTAVPSARALAGRAEAAVAAVTCRTRSGTYFGTGTIIHPDGLVMTSTTVVPPGAANIKVALSSGRTLSGRLVLVDPSCELAIVRLDRPAAGGEGRRKSAAALPFLPLGDSARVRLGDPAYTMGNAFQVAESERQSALCAGTVSGLYKLSSDDRGSSESAYRGALIETTAALNPGVDGGPLLNGRGEVIGLLSLAFSPTRTLGTAIPINLIKTRLEGSENAGGEFGLTVREERGALVVAQVLPGGAAEASGLRRGDRILGFAGRPVQTLGDWTDWLEAVPAGDRVRLEVERGGWQKTVTLQKSPARLGLELSWPAVERFALDPVLAAKARVYRAALRKVAPSVATLEVEKVVLVRGRGFFGRSERRRQSRRSSAVIVDADGLLLTSAWTLRGAESIKVRLADGRRFTAELLGEDASLDLALLKIDAEDLPVPTFGEPVDLRPGRLCAVVGRSLGSPTLTTGLISSVGRFRGNCYQVDAIMNLGNVGGALINTRGELIGVGAFVGDNPRWQWGLSSGVGFAVTMRKIREVLPALKRGETVDPMPVLGVESETGGLTISRVIEGSSAAKAGLRRGDKIVAVNGVALKGWGDLVKFVRTRNRGDRLVIELERGGRRLKLRARL